MQIDKSKYVADKIRKIVLEGRPLKEAVIIALNMYKRRVKK